MYVSPIGDWMGKVDILAGYSACDATHNTTHNTCCYPRDIMNDSVMESVYGL